MFRTHTCGELRISDVNKQVKLSGWVQRSRKMGGMTFVDLRDRYGITQLVFNEEKEEVISKLMATKIEFNTYDYALDNIFRDVQPIDIMEQYGDPITGQ